MPGSPSCAACLPGARSASVVCRAPLQPAAPPASASCPPGTTQDGMEQRNACPVCQGTGFEECMCTRWSDGDVGCSSCSKTGYMRCRGCGGGGKAVPLLVKVRRD